MADGTVMWSLETGKCLYIYDFGLSASRAVGLSVGDQYLAMTTDIFGATGTPKINICKVPTEMDIQECE